MTIRSITFGASARLVDLAADCQRAERGTRFEKPLLLKNNQGNHQKSPAASLLPLIGLIGEGGSKVRNNRAKKRTYAHPQIFFRALEV